MQGKELHSAKTRGAHPGKAELLDRGRGLRKGRVVWRLMVKGKNEASVETKGPGEQNGIPESEVASRQPLRARNNKCADPPEQDNVL